MERCCELAVYMAGGAVGFYSGYLKNVSSDMKTLRPTILPAVPRFLNRIYRECVTTANKTSFFRQVFNLGLQLKTDELYKGKDSLFSVFLSDLLHCIFYLSSSQGEHLNSISYTQV